MATETFALLRQSQPASVGEDDYQSFCAALGASARGRAFLVEYARRNRHADTEVVLAALFKLEAAARNQGVGAEAERIRQDLRALLDTIRAARPQIDHSPGAIKAATLAALIDFVQARIEALVTNARAPLAEVPPPEQPELPIPSPVASSPPAIALVQTAAAPPVAERDVAPADRAHEAVFIPEVNFADSAQIRPVPIPATRATARAAAEPANPSETVTPLAESIPTPAAETAAQAPPLETRAIDTRELETAVAALIETMEAASPAVAAPATAEPSPAPVARLPAIELPMPEPIASSARVETQTIQIQSLDTRSLETQVTETQVLEIQVLETQTSEPGAAIAALTELFELTLPDVIMPSAIETPAAAPEPGPDPLAEIMALSDDERMALFT